MRTDKQREASRRNGAKSRGPKSPATKAVSSRNAWIHGFTAQSVTAGGEKPEAYTRLLQAVYNQCGGQGVIQQIFAEQMASAYWQIHRTSLAASAMFDQAVAAQPPDVPVPGAFAAALSSLARAPEFDLVQRYHTALDTRLRRAFYAVLKAINSPALGTPNTPLRNEPGPHSSPVESETSAPPEPEPQPKPQPKQSEAA